MYATVIVCYCGYIAYAFNLLYTVFVKKAWDVFFITDRTDVGEF